MAKLEIVDYEVDNLVWLITNCMTCLGSSGIISRWTVPRERPLRKVQYVTPRTPSGYRCYRCHARGVKLWRRYMDFADPRITACQQCLEKQFGQTSAKVCVTYDRIRYWIPAVPDPTGMSFYLYERVPIDAQNWWHSLPSCRPLALSAAATQSEPKGDLSDG